MGFILKPLPAFWVSCLLAPPLRLPVAFSILRPARTLGDDLLPDLRERKRIPFRPCTRCQPGRRPALDRRTPRVLPAPHQRMSLQKGLHAEFHLGKSSDPIRLAAPIPGCPASFDHLSAATRRAESPRTRPSREPRSKLTQYAYRPPFNHKAMLPRPMPHFQCLKPSAAPQIKGVSDYA
jgi:hypothetical protein